MPLTAFWFDFTTAVSLLVGALAGLLYLRLLLAQCDPLRRRHPIVGKAQLLVPVVLVLRGRQASRSRDPACPDRLPALQARLSDRCLRSRPRHLTSPLFRAAARHRPLPDGCRCHFALPFAALEVGQHLYWQLGNFKIHGQVFLSSWVVIGALLAVVVTGTRRSDAIPGSSEPAGVPLGLHARSRPRIHR